MADAVLSCHDVGRVLSGHGRRTVALRSVSLDVGAGESLAIVGRSGSGKSTLVGVLAALDRPDSGEFRMGGQDVWAASARRRRTMRRLVGVVFQDALSSFDPRYRVGQVIGEGVDTPGRVAELMDRMGLDPDLLDRHPASLSGGQAQRVALARALAGGPRVLLADEPTRGLDVLAQERLIADVNLLRASEELVVVVVVTHDLRVARRLADRIVVMADGLIVEDIPGSQLDQADHPATRELLAAAPTLGPTTIAPNRRVSFPRRCGRPARR